MVKVLVYGYATGVFSSRKLARKLHEDRRAGPRRQGPGTRRLAAQTEWKLVCAALNLRRMAKLATA